jgi:SAM-dependent methyltransferase
MTTPDERGLAAAWTFVRPNLPPAPATVVDVGCGPLGGFVPALLANGYDAVGVDPNAPEGPDYRQVRFEEADVGEADAVVASASLHHAGDLGVIADRIAEVLRPGGTLVVVEWAWERLDEATAEWCFARLPDEPGWLHHHRDNWRESGESWDTFLQRAMADHGVLPAERVIEILDERFERRSRDDGPFFFADLRDDVTEADEQAAVDAGEIQTTGIRYVATRR